MFLFRAPFVVPVHHSIIKDGGILVSEGIILATGPFRELKGAAEVVEFDNRVLVPSLVNAHCHLELSHLAELGKNKNSGPLTGWIKQLLELRLKKKDDDFLKAGQQALTLLAERGTGLVADIGNSPESAEINISGNLRRLFFLELMGISRTKEKEAMEIAEQSALACTPHAPYSAGPDLLKYLKKRAEAAGRIFSIHLAESEEEILFLKEGIGPFRDFLEEKGLWDESFHLPGCGTVEYLDQLKVLDVKSLLVHCVHLTSKELDIVARRGSHVCLCPSSNKQLGVGLAPVDEMLARGIVPALGTDSLASNSRLDIWEEMALLKLNWPDIDPVTVFEMATMAGAQACGVDDLGSLAPGSAASILAVDYGDTPEKEIMEYLTSGNKTDKVRWATK